MFGIWGAIIGAIAGTIIDILFETKLPREKIEAHGWQCKRCKLMLYSKEDIKEINQTIYCTKCADYIQKELQEVNSEKERLEKLANENKTK